MRIRVVSDLHCEMHRDRGWTLAVEICQDLAFDVLVLAGDIATDATLDPVLTMFCELVAPKPVLFVLGNHEYYGGSVADTETKARAVAEVFPNLHVLEGDIVELQGQRFLGCTLWYEHPNWLPSDADFGDFNHIEGFADFVHQQAMDSADFLRSSIQPGDVVITHFLPHPESIAPKYRFSSSNGYFLHNVSDIVRCGEAKLWIHGHTHSSVDYTINQTRVICNPFGYATRPYPGEPNPEFKSLLTVRV